MDRIAPTTRFLTKPVSLFMMPMNLNMTCDSRITVLIATYNRASSLRETLLALSLVQRASLEVEFVVLDNCSVDDTALVVAELGSLLPVRRFVATRPGKSCALNDALGALDLGGTVAFLDDDVTPSVSWLQEVARTVACWPHYSVFGGRVDPQWPAGDPPLGLRQTGARMWGLGEHGFGSEECSYPPTITPVGANWWARREVFRDGRRFDEAIGPTGAAVIMGEDTKFLLRLNADGYPILHVPTAQVWHRIQAEKVTDRDLSKRAYAQGVGGPHTSGFCQPALLARSPMLWRLRRRAALLKAVCAFCISKFGLPSERLVRLRYDALSKIAYNRESLRLSKAGKIPTR